MNFKEIQELIRMISKSDLASFKIKNGDFELNIKTGKAVQHVEMKAPNYGHPLPPPPIQAPVVQKNQSLEEPQAAVVSVDNEKKLLEIRSPMVGTFYRSSGPDKGPYVKIGDQVSSGNPVCIIEAMKLFNEIESEISGTIVKIMVEDASPVEYDQVLFLVEP